jgi:endonuclease/exonuclease/phosphatase (EEP) superfamily protein YafD
MTKRSSVSIVGLLEVATIALAVFSIATLFGEWHRYLELFTHFRAQYFYTAVLLSLIFGILRRRSMSLLLVVLAVINATFLAPWYISAEQPPANGKTITLMQANVWRSNQDTSALLDQIAEVRPDVVVLQEMSAIWQSTMEELAEDYPFSVVQAHEGPFGIGMFSKFPLLDASVVLAPPIDLPEIRATLQFDEQRIRLVSSHPMSPVGAASVAARNEQLRVLGAELASAQRPTILIGDLNVSMWAPTYERFETMSGMRNARKGFGLVPTFPVYLPIAGIPIDHVLVSDDIAVLEFRQGARTGSDHWPIIVRLGLPE